MSLHVLVGRSGFEATHPVDVVLSRDVRSLGESRQLQLGRRRYGETTTDGEIATELDDGLTTAGPGLTPDR